MTIAYAEKLRDEWRLRNCRALPCTHLMREAEGENGNTSETYVCVRCGNPVKVTST